MTKDDGAEARPGGAEALSGDAGFEAVIFDLDGVLVDSEIWWDEVRADLARAHGQAWTLEHRRAVMGANSPTWARIIRDEVPIDLPADEIERLVVAAMVARYLTRGTPEIPGAAATVRRVAARLPVAVASSAHMDVIRAAISGLGLDGVFGAVASSDEVPLGKPSPDVYRLAARRLGVDPGRCLVVEDSLNGVRAGKAAGMAVVLVPNESIPPAEGAAVLADRVIRALDELDGLVGRP